MIHYHLRFIDVNANSSHYGVYCYYYYYRYLFVNARFVMWLKATAVYRARYTSQKK